MSNDGLSEGEMPGEEWAAMVRRIFVRAAERLGSAAELGRHLGLSYAELRPYLYGQAMPPETILLRAVDIVIDELKVLKTSCSESTWRSLSLPGSNPRP
jgi:hypothetical protein